MISYEELKGTERENAYFEHLLEEADRKYQDKIDEELIDRQDSVSIADEMFHRLGYKKNSETMKNEDGYSITFSNDKVYVDEELLYLTFEEVAAIYYKMKELRDNKDE